MVYFLSAYRGVGKGLHPDVLVENPTASAPRKLCL
jgi:hypothetical protein